MARAGLPGLIPLENPDMSQFKAHIDANATRITFPAKPDESIRAMLKGAGFRWSRDGYWWRRGCKGAADFIAALDRKLSPDRPDGACWRCQSPQGFFRPQGAATPVYCNPCFALAKGEGPLGADDAPFEKPEHTCRADRFDMDYEDRCRDACGL